MRICHVITRLIVGGAQENTLLTCEGLHRKGHEVILMVGPETGREGSLWRRAERGGYTVERVDTLVRGIGVTQDIRCLRALKHRFTELRPAVVHTHSSKAGVLGRMAARQADVPAIVHTIHGMSFNRTQPWHVRSAYRWMERRCARSTDAFITVADAMTDQAVAAGLAERARFITIYSGMETDAFDSTRYDRPAVRAEWGVAPEHVVVGTIARLFRNKGYEQLIPAMERAAEANKRLRFVWVGDGDQRAEYETMLRDRGLADRVHLTGLVAPDEVPRLLAGMDLLAHASQWEGLPRVAVQALLMEVPVAGFAIDGTPEVVIPGETGELVTLNDIDGLASAIERLAGDADRRRRFGRAGRELCLSRFAHTTMTDQIEAVYQGLIRRSHRSPT